MINKIVDLVSDHRYRVKITSIDASGFWGDYYPVENGPAKIYEGGFFPFARLQKLEIVDDDAFEPEKRKVEAVKKNLANMLSSADFEFYLDEFADSIADSRNRKAQAKTDKFLTVWAQELFALISK